VRLEGLGQLKKIHLIGTLKTGSNVITTGLKKVNLTLSNMKKGLR
jgi:hypothetical protein